MFKFLRKLFKVKRNKAYVSPVDIFQATFDQTHLKSASQQAEIKKHQRIYALRDKAVKTDQ
jgi:hypothetical protein